VLARIVNMRGVNLNVFSFDYDLTWAAFFQSADEKIYGRFGGRTVASPDAYLSLTGLKYAMRQALQAHKNGPRGQPEGQPKPVQTVEQYPAAQRLKTSQCIHCHQVYDFRREPLKAEGKWTLDEVWVYPEPGNIGLTLDVDQGDRIKTVAVKSPAARAGLKPGDVLRTVNGLRVASYADVQHALHLAPRSGTIPVTWERDGQDRTASLKLAEGWRKTDISWRGSMWGLEPAASVHGKDLTAGEKEQLGLSPRALAFRQGAFVPPAAREAGIRPNDIILGIDGKPLEMTVLQFNAYVRLNCKVGERVTYNVLRDGKRIDIPMKLPARTF
jgi:predicted metalloprotease with PDZ domain